MKSNPKVSVLIPNYNYARFIGEAIESVLNQTYTDFELLIVDNHSTDNTDAVVAPYLKDTRVRFIKNPRNIGMVPNFNKCLELAKGEYIKFLLSDDIFHPELLSKFVKVLDENPGVGIVTSDSESFGAETQLRTSPFKYLQKGEFIIRESIKDGKGNFIGEPTTVMFRASNLKVGNFDREFSCLNDLDFWLRQLTISDCYFIPETLSYFRVHDAQASFVKNYANWFDEYNFYKRVKTVNAYKVPTSDLNIDTMIKKTALKSAGAMYELLPALSNKKNRSLFLRAFKIALKEGVLGSSVVVYRKKRKKHTARPALQQK
jgi:glycosyltransferase involved in cell wall biosynthesis